MAKKGRGTPPRATKKKATAQKGGAPRSNRRTATKAKARPTARKTARKATRPAARPSARPTPRKAAPPKPQPAAVPVPASPPPAPPPRKPGFYEAVAIYERGVQALQRHDFQTAAEHFRQVIQRYPEERELLERAHLYLRVCERETARQAAAEPQQGDPIYSATLALNSGDPAAAISHIQRALASDPDNDHAHYIMAVALTARGRRDEAIDHLKRSIGLNPSNRSQAREDQDLEPLRGHEGYRAALETPPIAGRKAVAARRR